MNPSRPLAVAAVAVLLIGTATVWNGDSRNPRLLTTATRSTSTTTVFELPAIVASGTVNLEEETSLIEEATTAAAEAATTTTEPSTTTTFDDATTTTTTEPSPTTSKATGVAPTTTTPESTTAPPTTEAAGGYDPGAESDFASSINSFRSGNGESSLTRDGSLDSYARSWAKTMADNGGLSHSNIGSLVPPWSSVGENVGTGGSVGQIFDALVSSGSHSSTMLSDFTHLGVGVYRDSAGALWTVHVFTR